MSKERKRLVCNENGWIVVKTIKDNNVSRCIARHLKFRIDLRTNRGWMKQDEFDNAISAREAFGKRNRFFDYRLVAIHDIGEVRLPDNWKGPQ